MSSICMECPMCHNVYGKFRAQCPACGNPTPEQPRFNAPRVEAPSVRRRKERKLREGIVANVEARTSKTVCVFCKSRGAKQTCPTCGGLIHGGCRTLHECAKQEVTQ